MYQMKSAEYCGYVAIIFESRRNAYRAELALLNANISLRLISFHMKLHCNCTCYIRLKKEDKERATEILKNSRIQFGLIRDIN